MRIVSSLVFFLSIILDLSAQDMSTQNQTDAATKDPFSIFENIPSSPEMGTLGEYGKIDASSYNGKANINVPIHTINFDGLQLPIQLTHDSGGVRVAQEAGWVGLNWELSTTFGISRKIYGIDDFSNRVAGQYENAPLNGYIYNNLEPVLQSGEARPYLSIDDIMSVHHSYSLYSPVAIGTRAMDTQPDVFNVNVLGQSYKFILKKKEISDIIEAIVFDNNNVKISIDLNSMNFTLIDEQGFIYHFETKEVNTTFSSYSVNPLGNSSYLGAFANVFVETNASGQSMVTNWVLDRIVSPKGRTLHFEYEPGLHFTFPQYTFDYEGSDWRAKPDLASQYEESDRETNWTLSFTVIENNYLSRIWGDFGEVDFLLGDREDLTTGHTIHTLSSNNFGSNVLVTSQSQIRSCHGTPNCSNSSVFLPKKLDGIQIKNIDDDILTNVELNYSYFNSSRLNVAIKERYFRLKLESLSINDQDYIFSYLNSETLAAKDSYGVDFWGFYNGRNTNPGRVPRISRFVNSGLTTGTTTNGVTRELGQVFARFPGADRGSDFNFGKNGLLKTIFYPTGGSTTFEYEPHDVVLEVPKPFQATEHFSGGRYKWTNMTNEDNFNSTYQYLKCADDATYNFFEKTTNFNQGDAVTVNQPFGTSFSVNFPSVIEISSTLSTIFNYDGMSFWGGSPLLVVEETNTGREYLVFTYGDSNTSLGGQAIERTKTIGLPPGDYIIKQKTASLSPGQNPLNFPPIPVINLNDKVALLHTFQTIEPELLSEFLERFEVGGARVSKIIHRDGDESFMSSTQYTYGYPDGFDGLTSSGKLMDDLIFHKKATGFHSYNPRGYKSFFLTGSNVLGNTPAAQGSHIGYSYVRESQSDSLGNALGWVDKEYHNLKNEYFKDSFCLPWQWDLVSGNGDPYIEILGVQTKWFCSGLDLGNDCGGNQSTFYSTMGDACIQNAIILGIPLRLSYGHINGKVLKERIYDNGANLVQENINEYKLLNGNLPSKYFASFINIPMSFQSGANVNEVLSKLYNTTEGPWGTNHHTYYPYEFPRHHGLIAKEAKRTVTQYLENGIVTNESSFLYHDTTHFIKSSSLLNSEGEQISTLYYYPYDTESSSQTGVGLLVNENRIAKPVRTDRFLNSALLSIQKVHYGNSNLTSFITLPTSVESTKGIPEASDNGLMEERFTYERYGDNGNVLQYRPESGVPISLIWGHNRKYVVAKIENSTYEQIENLQLFGVNFDLGAGGLSSEQENQLRSTLTNSLITTYEHKPMTGITKLTDPRGYTTTFTYDENNRLKEVRDGNNHIVTDYRYEYLNMTKN